MAISLSTAVLALSGAGWGLVGGLLLTSAVIMVSVHQDLGLRVWIGAVLVSRGRGLLNNAAATRGEICPETVGCTPACWRRLTEAGGRDFGCNSGS
jgi:hypothetical protein